MERLEDRRQTFDVSLNSQITENHHAGFHLAVMDSRHHGDEEGDAAGGFNLAASEFYRFNRQVFLSH